ncbi:NT-3 growth factor receptor, partial [Tachysurus ichikawai]
RLEGVVFNCSCEIRWIQLWQQRGEAGLHNQQLFCNTGFSQIPLQLLNISHCDVPEISVTHSSLTVNEGDRVTITCNGSGVPVPDVDWKVNSLHSISTQQATQIPPHVHSLTLTLFNVSRDDNLSLLSCTTENIVGMSNTSVHLSVQFPPTIIHYETPERRHDTCMMFIVRGQPLPEVRFFYKDVELQETKYVRIDKDVYRDTLEGCLIFENPTHHNNGNYTLEARNSLGVANKTVDAHFMGAPFDGDYVEYVHPSAHSPVSPSLTPTIAVTHRPEEDTFGVSIAVGLAGFACVLLLVMFVLINKYGRRSKFGMKVYSYIACSHLADPSLLSSETESSPRLAEQLKAKGLDQEFASGFLAVVGFELVAF